MKKETWKFIIQTIVAILTAIIIQTIVAILTAILTSLGVTSCMN